MTASSPMIPSHDCPLCPRLAAFREANREAYPSFFNGPVLSFGSLEARMLIVGLAPGLKGANQTGRPFTRDYAGLVLYGGLLKTRFARGKYRESADDGLELVDCRVTNAVRCVPPQNKPETSEIRQCNAFLQSELQVMPRLKLILSLGAISHNAVLRATGHKASFAKFTHGQSHRLTNGWVLLDSYHCSRYNINTGLLTQAMFNAVLKQARQLLNAA